MDSTVQLVDSGRLPWLHGTPLRWWGPAILSVVGLAHSVYLWHFPASAYGDLPSAYRWVLGVRWGWLLGASMATWSCLLFLSTFFALMLAHPGRSRRTHRLANRLLAMQAGVFLAGFAWYIALVVTRQFDFFCRSFFALAALGLLTGCLLLRFLWASHDAAGTSSISGGVRHDGSPRFMMFTVVGALLLAGGATLQVLLPAPPVVQRLALELRAKLDYDTGPGPQRLVNPIGSQAFVSVHDAPILGSPDAPLILVYIFDYTDFSSRMGDLELRRLRQRYGGEVAILPIVSPQDLDCNPSAHRAADVPDVWPCILAKLSLAVWAVDPAKFEEFHEYLMTPDDLKQSRTPEQALARARQLVGEGPLQQALSDPRVQRQLRINLRAAASDAQDDTRDSFEPVTMWGPHDDKPGRFIAGRTYFADLCREIEQVWTFQSVGQDPLMRSLGK